MKNCIARTRSPRYARGPRKLPQVERSGRSTLTARSVLDQGDTATLERQAAPVQCREARYESLLADAASAACDSRRGNEPG